MAQLAFHWPHSSHYVPEDFIISACNQEAARLIQTWPGQNGSTGALLAGPEGCGKTHLAYCWQAYTNASFIDASRLGSQSSAELWGHGTHRILENIETIPNEHAFFHLLRHCELQGGHMLMTSRLWPRDLPFQLPDITSRLRALPLATIASPDEEMLRAYLGKYFSDHQWRVPFPVIDYIVPRIERSFASLHQLLAALEEALASTKKEITIPLIKPLVDKCT